MVFPSAQSSRSKAAAGGSAHGSCGRRHAITTFAVMKLDFSACRSGCFYDELIDAQGVPRPWARTLVDYLSGFDAAELNRQRAAVDTAIMTMGITFTIYSDGANIDRAWPFDIIPRVIPNAEWRRIAAGLKQRLAALNLFINDLYNQQSIVKDGVFPAEVLATSRNFRPECVGQMPRFGVWAHICGTDLVRDRDGTVYVLEDNLRVPSGVFLHA